jgi:hypothetical protein
MHLRRGSLERSLQQEHMSYKHIRELGGLRHARKDSLNLGWRNTSFRGFADYMATQEFSEGLEARAKIANARETAIMCAEAVPWRCHRSLIADALTKKGWIVRDIMSCTVVARHRLTPFLKTRKGQLIYPEEPPRKRLISEPLRTLFPGSLRNDKRVQEPLRSAFDELQPLRGVFSVQMRGLRAAQ